MIKRNDLKIYAGNQAKDINIYFDSEPLIKKGIETTGNIISIFEENGFVTKEIRLMGGVSELSHTGDLSYGAGYTDVKTFLDNAYSDYEASKKQAVEETRGWVSSYNFEIFAVTFEKNEYKVIVHLGAAKNIRIIYDNEIQIADELNKIVSTIKQNVYESGCVFKGMEQIATLAEELSVFNTIEHKSLYFISISGQPLLMRGDLILLYTDKQKADEAVETFRNSYKNNYIKVVSIEDNKLFVSKMTAAGFTKFLLDGNGKIWSFARFCTADSVKAIKDAENIYNEIKAAQENMRAKNGAMQELKPKNLKQAFQMLPKIHKSRFIIAFICAVLALVSGASSAFIGRGSKSPFNAILLVVAFNASLIGAKLASKVVSRVKERNPLIAKVTKLFIVFDFVAVLFIVLGFTD